jgi:phage terminase large subunit-like protein
MIEETRSLESLSPAELLASLPEDERAERLASLTEAQKAELRWHWPFWARPNQIAPAVGPTGQPWNTWLVLAGRGFGKTRMGSEWLRSIAEKHPGCRIALVGETAADVRDVMILGDSGLIACDPNLTEASWSPTNRRLSWPNGSTAWAYNATEPDQLRGPQHHFAWVDELAKFRYIQETWDQVMFGLRLGVHPQALVTTTPQPKQLIKKLVADSDTVVTRGSTMDNKANLAKNTIKQLYDRYSNTRLGRQELEGEILGDIPGALWTHSSIDEARFNLEKEELPDFERVIVAVDPAASSSEGADETGICVVAMARDADGYARGYVLEDASLRGTPEEWARAAVGMYRKHQADKIVAEKNQGGEMVETVLRTVDRSIPIKLVHASRGKVIRAEPISALYEQGRVHHVGKFDKLEDQMCSFSVDLVRNVSEGSPDRVDALVWGLTELFEKMTGRSRKAKVGTNSNGVVDIVVDETKYKDRWTSNHPNMWMAG